MHKRTAMELYETKRILTRNNQTNRFKTTTKNMSKMLKISPSKARKFIELLEDEKFLVCENKPKQIGRGAWSKYEIHIINPLDINKKQWKEDFRKTPDGINQNNRIYNLYKVIFSKHNIDLKKEIKKALPGFIDFL